MKPSFYARLLDFNGNVLAAGVGCCLHDLANCLSNSSVTADYHTCVVLCNGENKLNVVSVDSFLNLYGIGVINDSAGDVGKYYFKIHFQYL